jgi:UDP-2-acetamido-2-deoxy-ribo-hexuluronate aminotransferase
LEQTPFVVAKPIFVDIDSNIFNLSNDLLKLTLETIKNNKEHKSSATCSDIKDIKAIISVDLFGLPADAGLSTRFLKSMV